MAGRYDFQSRFGRSDDVWFKVGSVGVTTTIGLIGLWIVGVVLTFAWSDAIDSLALTGETFAGLELWRLVTWIAPNSLRSIFSLFILYMIYVFGSQLEQQMGRRDLFRLVVALTVVPAAVYALTAIFFYSRVEYGLDTVELGLLVAFAARFPWVRFFFGIPAPVMIGIFVVLRLMSQLGSLPGVLLTLSTVVLAVMGMRSLGYADDLHQIPRIDIPGLTPGTASTRIKRPSRPKRGVSRSGSVRGTSSRLRAVPDEDFTTKASSPSSPEIDAILDQINESGFSSLSDQQKAQLEAYSNRLRRDKD